MDAIGNYMPHIMSWPSLDVGKCSTLLYYSAEAIFRNSFGLGTSFLIVLALTTGLVHSQPIPLCNFRILQHSHSHR